MLSNDLKKQRNHSPKEVDEKPDVLSLLIQLIDPDSGMSELLESEDMTIDWEFLRFSCLLLKHGFVPKDRVRELEIALIKRSEENTFLPIIRKEAEVIISVDETLEVFGELYRETHERYGKPLSQLSSFVKEFRDDRRGVMHPAHS